jgi:hypothetical protein
MLHLPRKCSQEDKFQMMSSMKRYILATPVVVCVVLVLAYVLFGPTDTQRGRRGDDGDSSFASVAHRTTGRENESIDTASTDSRSTCDPHSSQEGATSGDDAADSHIDTLLQELRVLCERKAHPADLIQLLVKIENFILDEGRVDTVVPLLVKSATDRARSEWERLFCILLLGCAQHREEARNVLLAVFRGDEDRIALVALYALMIRHGPSVKGVGGQDLTRPESRRGFWYAAWRSYDIGPILTGAWEPANIDNENWDKDAALGLRDEAKRHLLDYVAAYVAAEARVIFDMPDQSLRYLVMDRIRACRDSKVKCAMLTMLPNKYETAEFAMELYWNHPSDEVVRAQALIETNSEVPDYSKIVQFYIEALRQETRWELRCWLMNFLADDAARGAADPEAVADLFLKQINAIQDWSSPEVAASMEPLGILPLQSTIDYVASIARRTTWPELRRACYYGIGIPHGKNEMHRIETLSQFLSSCPSQDLSMVLDSLVRHLKSRDLPKLPNEQLIAILENSIMICNKRSCEIDEICRDSSSRNAEKLSRFLEQAKSAK